MNFSLVKEAIDILERIASNAATAFCNIAHTISNFDSRLAQLLNTIESVNSILNDERIEQCRECPFKRTVGRLTVAVKQAEQFADKCSKVSWWNFYVKYIYSMEIANLNDSLSSLPDKVELGLENINLRQLTDAMNEKLDRLVLLLENKSNSGVVTRIMRIFESVTRAIHHQLTSIAERYFSRNEYHRLSIIN